MVKKGQFFSLDAFLALSIFVIAMVLLYSFYTAQSPQHQQYYYADDLSNFFSSTKINELNIDMSTYSLKEEENDGEKTISDAIRKLQILGKTQEAKNLVEFLVKDLIPEKYGIAFYMQDTDTPLYETTTEGDPTKIVSRSKYTRASYD